MHGGIGFEAGEPADRSLRPVTLGAGGTREGLQRALLPSHSGLQPLDEIPGRQEGLDLGLPPTPLADAGPQLLHHGAQLGSILRRPLGCLGAPRSPGSGHGARFSAGGLPLHLFAALSVFLPRYFVPECPATAALLVARGTGRRAGLRFLLRAAWVGFFPLSTVLLLLRPEPLLAPDEPLLHQQVVLGPLLLQQLEAALGEACRVDAAGALLLHLLAVLRFTPHCCSPRLHRGEALLPSAQAPDRSCLLKTGQQPVSTTSVLQVLAMQQGDGRARGSLTSCVGQPLRRRRLQAEVGHDAEVPEVDAAGDWRHLHLGLVAGAAAPRPGLCHLPHPLELLLPLRGHGGLPRTAGKRGGAALPAAGSSLDLLLILAGGDSYSVEGARR